MIIRKDLRRFLRLRFNDGKAWVGQIAPDIVADFLARVFHVAHKNAFAFLVQIVPEDCTDFLLSPRREESKRIDVLHGNALFAEFFFALEMLNKQIKFSQGRAALTTGSFAG